jgi:transposase
MKFKNFVGIDVSKSSVDFSIIKDQKFLFHQRIENSKDSVNMFLKELKFNHKIGGKSTLFCMENIGLYCNNIVGCLRRAKSLLWMESPLQIKLSLGLQRGKNDKIDSLRIAQYCQQNHQKAVLLEEPREIIQKLKQLSTVRLRLGRLAKAIKTPISYIKAEKKMFKDITALCTKSMKAINSDLKNIEERMLKLIKNDERLSHLFDILVSIDGVGEVLAIQLIIVTNEFTNFHSAKKFACYCGISPFEHSSGSSTKGKSKVSRVANMKMKSALHLPTVSAIRCDGDIRNYYKKKVAEGHPTMSVLNAAKNKLVQRIFACIKEDRLYRKDYSSLVSH